MWWLLFPFTIYFLLSHVEFAILEIDGELSVLKKAPYNTVTPNDLNIPVSYTGLTIDLIINGRFLESNLDLYGKDKKWLYKHLNSKNINDTTDVIYAGITSENKLDIITKNK